MKSKRKGRNVFAQRTAKGNSFANFAQGFASFAVKTGRTGCRSANDGVVLFLASCARGPQS